MIALYDADTETAGTWQLLRLSGGGVSALIYCPKCGRIGSLEDHSITPDGVVSPSVDCPYDDCNFHDYVQLLGWHD